MYKYFGKKNLNEAKKLNGSGVLQSIVEIPATILS